MFKRTRIKRIVRMLIKHLKQGTQAAEPTGLIRAIWMITSRWSVGLRQISCSKNNQQFVFKRTRIKRIYRMLIKSSSKELKLKSPQGLFALIWTIDNPLYLSDNPIQDAYVDKSALKKESTFVGQRKYLRLLLLLVLLLLQIFLWQE